MIHIAIISHGHQDLLIDSGMCGLLSEKSQITIWLKDNKPSEKLQAYCSSHDIFYTNAQAGLGFGHNNNFIFNLIKTQVGFNPDDMFIVMNPDITITPETLYAFVAQMQKDQRVIGTLNLYRDLDMTIPDTNIRHYPGLLSILKMPFVNSFSQTYNKEKIDEHHGVDVDWASGAFLAFMPQHYEALEGFDTAYFMYFEDVDICYRSQNRFAKMVHYYPRFKAVHMAAHKNRNIASQHARWFFKSFLIFLVRRYFIYRPLQKTITKQS